MLRDGTWLLVLVLVHLPSELGTIKELISPPPDEDMQQGKKGSHGPLNTEKRHLQASLPVHNDFMASHACFCRMVKLQQSLILRLYAANDR